MYNGYRIKLNGTIFPNKYIAKGSFKITNQKRVIEIWKDSNQVEHEVTVASTKALITFTIIPRSFAEHQKIMEFTALRYGGTVTVEYYDDKNDVYKTASCRLENITFSHRNTYGGSLQYDSANVKLIEN